VHEDIENIGGRRSSGRADYAALEHLVQQDYPFRALEESMNTELSFSRGDKIYEFTKATWLSNALLCFLLLSLTSCLELKQAININKDGSGDARLEVTVQQEWAPQIIPKLKQDIPKGWTLIEEKQRDGKQIIVIGRKFKDITELNDDEAQYSFSSERKGFLKKTYILNVRQLKSSDAPFPFEFVINMPGGIDETNGNKVSSDVVKWNLQGFRRGTELSVKSSAFALPDFASLKESFDKVFNSVFFREAIVFLRDNNIWVMDNDGKSQRQLTKEGVGDFSVSRDGKIVFNKMGRGVIYFIDLVKGSQIKQLTNDNGNMIPSISPDGTNVAFYKTESVNFPAHIIDISKGFQRELPFTPFPKIIREKIYMPEADWQWFVDGIFQWSTDSKKLAFRRCSGDKDKPTCLVFLHEVDSTMLPIIVGEELALNDRMIPNFYPIGFTQDSLLFATPVDIYLYRYDKKECSLLARDAWRGKISPDGKDVAYLSSFRSGGANLWLIGMDGRDKRRLTNFSNMMPVELSWNLDGKQLVFELRSEQTAVAETWRINRDGSNLQKVTDNIIWEIPVREWKARMPRITFISPKIAKIIILVTIALTGLLLLFGIALMTRKATIKAAAPAPKPMGVEALNGIFCTQCGTENPASASFCKKCGNKLR
jgi:hypothetical protein